MSSKTVTSLLVSMFTVDTFHNYNHCFRSVASNSQKHPQIKCIWPITS